jgi:cyclic pyranopterin phosphate synthase
MITHLSKKNKANMVDISDKNQTIRFAKAQGIVKFSKKTFNEISSFKSKKGEITNTAIIAGIIGVKKTSEIIPLCHNIIIDNIDLEIRSVKNKNAFIITCSVKSFGKTGVEMEALNGVSVACLTIYDMCKSIDKKIIIKDIKLLKKTGGNSDFIQH